MVTLQRVLHGNPFADHPALRAIFGARAAHVEADTLADLRAGDQDPARNHVALVLDSTGQVVGITGFYQPDPADPTTLGLRWHGIVPSHRRHGHSAAAFRAVCQAVTVERPQAQALVEYVPLANPVKGEHLTAYFQQLGFERVGPDADATTFPASASLPAESGRWRAMRHDLRHASPPGSIRHAVPHARA